MIETFLKTKFIRILNHKIKIGTAVINIIKLNSKKNFWLYYIQNKLKEKRLLIRLNSYVGK